MPLIGFEYEVVGDQDADREARPNGDGRLNVQRPADDLLANLAEALRRALTDRLGKIVFAVAGAGLGADAEQGREDRGFEQHAPVIIDLILQAGIALGSAPGWRSSTIELAVRHDQAIPDQQRARLSEGDLGVVLPDQARALRDQQEFAGRAVIDILGNLCGDLAGQIRSQTVISDAGITAPACSTYWLAGGWIAIGADGASIDVAIEEGELVILRRQVG